MAKEELEIEDELDIDEMHFEETQQEESTTTHKGQVRFKSVNHSERATKFGRMSDGETAKYLNVALEYFDNRCALSGEKFVQFDKKTEGKSTNLSAEHVVALCIGGHDIVPNLTPTVLQYNIRKNGYYLLDYWYKQKDSNGKSIYSPYRLLKLVNYMMKSVKARGVDVKEYSKAILEPNAIDNYLDEIKQQDLEETDNAKRKLLSDTITATTIDEDNKKILTVVPTIEGSMPAPKAQAKELEIKNYDERIMIDIFLTDAVKELAKVEEISNQEITLENGIKVTIQQELEQMLKETIGEIPFEVSIRDRILKVLEENNIENRYSVATDLLQNTRILKQAKANEVEVEKQIQERINSVNFENLTQEQKEKIIAINPQILYNEQEKEETSKLLQLYMQNHNGNIDEINVELLSKICFVNALKIKKWMDKNGTTKPPRDQNSNKTVSKEEYELGSKLSSIRSKLIKPYLKLQTDEEKKEYKGRHPEIEEVMAIVEKIDKNNVPTRLANAQEIRQWMIDNNTSAPPREQNKQKTISEEESRLGQKLRSIRSQLIKPYLELETEEERQEYKRQHPELEKVIGIVEEIDRKNMPIKEEQPYYINILEIKSWMERGSRTKPPSQSAKDDDVEKNFGGKLSNIRQNLIKPYLALQTEEERQEYKRQHPELEEVMTIVEEIDRNNMPIKEEQPYYINILEIKSWMERESRIKPPSRSAKDDDVEKNFGEKLSNIRQNLIKPYLVLQTDEEKKEYKKNHPELEEVMAIVEEIDINNVPIFLANAREIKKWMQENKTTIPPRKQNKNKTVSKEEYELGSKLSSIRSKLIKPYKELQTEEERQEYKRQHPETEEVMAMVEEIDKNNVPIYLENARRIKDWIERESRTKPPSTGKDADDIEKKLGESLARIRQKLIKPYLELQMEEERQEYKEQHPELEEVMAIVEEIDRNNVRKKGVVASLEEEKRVKIKTLEEARSLESKIDTEIAKVKQRKNDEIIR